MRNKLNGVLLLGIVFLFLGIMSSVSAATTLNKPADNSIVAGPNIVLNVTQTSPGTNFTCAVYVKSASTANSSWSLISSLTNTTVTEAYKMVNLSLVVEDSNNYQFNATCNNNTGFLGVDVNTGITIDNTIPQAPSLSPATETIDADGSVDFSGTVTDRNTTGCTLYFSGKNPGQTSYTMTYATTSCTYTLSLPDETYDWYVSASDGSNTTSSSVNRITTDVKTSSGKAAVLITEKGVKSAGGSLLEVTGAGSGLTSTIAGIELWVWIVIGVIILVVYLIAKRR